MIIYNIDSVTLESNELQALARMPEAVQLVIDWYHVQDAEADAIGTHECIEPMERRRMDLEVYRDRLLTKRGESPGSIDFVYGATKR